MVPADLQAIYDYHQPFSTAKAERIVTEYDRIIALLELNPLIFHPREDDWRVYPFSSGTYLLYYREFPAFWLVVGVFHARREHSWISDQVSGRLKRVL